MFAGKCRDGHWKGTESCDGKSEAIDAVENGKALAQRHRKASLRAYRRTQEPAKQRQARTEKMPEHFARRIKDDPSQDMKLFENWMACEEVWGLVVLTEELELLERKHTKRVWRWLNTGQMLEHYKLEGVVKSMILDASKDPCKWRPAPGAVEEKEATEFLCLVVDETVEEVEHVRRQIVKLKTEIDQKTAQNILPSRFRRSMVHTKPQPQTAVFDDPKGDKEKEKEAEKEKDRKEKEKAEKARIDRERREAYKSSDKGQADTWIKALNKDVATLNNQMADLRKAMSIPTGVKNELMGDLQHHKAMLEKLKSNLENVSLPEAEKSEEVKSCLGRAKTIVTQAQQAMKKYKKVKTLFK